MPDVLAQIRRARGDVETAEELGGRDRGPADDFDCADPRPIAGLNREDQRRAFGRMFRLGVDGHRRMQVSALSERILEQPFHIGRAAGRRRHAIPVHYDLPQRAPIDPRASGARKPDRGDRMNGAELVAQCDASVLERRVHPHILEPSQAEEMRDGLPHLRHRERPAGLGFDHLGQRRIGGFAPLDDEPDRGDRLVEKRADVRVSRHRVSQQRLYARCSAPDLPRRH